MKLEKLLDIIFDNYTFNGRKDHIITDCPFCGKEKHFFLNVLKFEKKNRIGLYYNSWDCKKCGEIGNIVKLLQHLNKLDLLEDEKILLTKKLENKIKINEESFFKNIETVLPEKKLPVGFYRIYSDEYLESRGLKEFDFKKYVIGKTDVLFKYKNYVIISLLENGKCRGFIARYRESKENMKNFDYKILRWNNSKNTDFSKMLLGYDEINFFTKTVILVEGFFDKKNVDEYLNLDYINEIKCCSTYGKNISLHQIKKLIEKNIENLIIVQDPDAIKETKKFVFDYKKYFKNIYVGFTGEKDLGDSNENEIINIFNNLQTPFLYNISKIAKKELI